MAKRYEKHRNYRLPAGLAMDLEAFAKENNISESEATRILLTASVRRMKDLGLRNLPAEDRNIGSTD